VTLKLGYNDGERAVLAMKGIGGKRLTYRPTIRSVASSIVGFSAMPPRKPKPPTPKASNPWDIPERPTTPTKDPNDIFRAIGDALSSWESVEHYTAMIFTLLVAENPPKLPLPHSGPAVRAYGSVVSFQARAAMVEAAARAFFYLHPHQKHEDRLKKLMKAANGWSARRNDIAHGNVAGCPWDLNQCLLWPSDYNSKKYSVERRPAYLYNDAQIMDFRNGFYGLSDQMGKFFSEFWEWRLRARARGRAKE
jgi:hypothetical protein